MKKNIILFSFVLFSFLIIGIDKVNAACTTHTNYYFYSFTDWYTAFDGKEFPYKQVNTASFSDELPVGAVPESAKYNWIDFSAEEDGWTFRKFWEIKKDVANDIDVIKNGDEWYFVHTATWIHDNTGEVNDDNLDTSKFKIEDMVRNSYYAVVEDGTMALRIQDTPNNIITGTVVRTIEETWKDFAEAARAQTASDGSHPTDGQIWMPALLQVKFEVCETTPDKAPTPENKYNVIVKYVDDATNEEIREQTNLGSFKTGEDYLAECYDTIDDYTLTSQKEIGGTMANSDVTLYCRYNKEKEPTTDVPTFDLTINYLDKNTNEPIKDPYHDPNAYKSGDNYTAECLDSVGSGYILDSYIGNLTGTFADDDIVINCLYVTEPVQTSDIPLQIVFIVAAVALGYSIYYLVKYYKPQNMAK